MNIKEMQIAGKRQFKYKKTVLILRYGGIGDAIFLTPVFREFKKRGWTVHFAIRDEISDLFKFDKYIDKLFPIKRFGPYGVDTIWDEEFNVWGSVESLKPLYELVIDYKNSIENNSLYPNLPYGSWVRTQNSNYVNIYDLSLGWANIDPMEVEDKRPHYFMNNEEYQYSRKIKSKFKNSKIIGISLYASSLARTFYLADELPNILGKKYPGSVIFFWDGTKWLIFQDGMMIDEMTTTRRQSAALLSIFDLFITADSGYSHIAEALGVKQIVLYTTVKWWTRSLYYKHTYPIQAKVKCSPCFIIDMNCPKIEEMVWDALSDRERKIFELHSKKVPVREAAKIMQTTVQGLENEFRLASEKINVLRQREPDCMKSITVEDILEYTDLILLGREYKFESPKIEITGNVPDDFKQKISERIKSNERSRFTLHIDGVFDLNGEFDKIIGRLEKILVTRELKAVSPVIVETEQDVMVRIGVFEGQLEREFYLEDKKSESDIVAKTTSVIVRRAR